MTPYPEAKSSEFRVQSSVGGVWAIANGTPLRARLFYLAKKKRSVCSNVTLIRVWLVLGHIASPKTIIRGFHLLLPILPPPNSEL